MSDSQWLLIDACGRMVGVDRAVFECGSCSEFQAEFAVNRTDSAQDDCHFARAIDFVVGADVLVGAHRNTGWPDHVFRQTAVVSESSVTVCRPLRSTL